MGTVLGKDIVNKASATLRDQLGRRWSPSELLGYLNDGQREIGILKPDSCTVLQTIPMVAGAEQTVPDNVVRLVSVSHNMGAGTAVGAPIKLIDQDELDMLDPTWRTASPADVVIHYTFDARSPKFWNCYPPQLTGGKQVRAMVLVNPTEVTIDGVDEETASTAIFLDDIYQTALHDYIVSRAYEKNDETRDLQRSSMFYGRLERRLGLKQKNDVDNGPNKNAPPAQQSRQVGGASQRARAD